jgi:hypothetical protein
MNVQECVIRVESNEQANLLKLLHVDAVRLRFLLNCGDMRRCKRLLIFFH